MTPDYTEIDGTTNFGRETRKIQVNICKSVGNMNGNGTPDIKLSAWRRKVYLFDTDTTGSTEEAYWHWQLIKYNIERHHTLEQISFR